MSQRKRNLTAIGVQPHTELMHIERLVDARCWMLWTHCNKTRTIGTSIVLHDDGKIERVVTEPDGSTHIFLIKPPDEELSHERQHTK